MLGRTASRTVGWKKYPRAVRSGRATGSHPGSLFDGAVDVPRHASALLIADERPDVGLGIGRIADPQSLGALDQELHEAIEHRLSDEQARRGCADLAGVVERLRGGGVGRPLQVGVVQDDERGLAPELQVAQRDALGGRPQDRPPDLGGTGERDRGHPGMADERRARLRPAVHDVHDAGRKAGLEAESAEEVGRERRLLRGFQHDGVAACECRRSLRDREVEREVPRRDRRHHSVWHPMRAGGEARLVREGHAADVLRQRRVVPQHLDRGGDLAASRDERLAGVQRLRLGDLVQVRLEHVRELAQQGGAPTRRRHPPAAVIGLPRRGHGRVDLGVSGERDVGEHLLGRGVETLERPAVARLPRRGTDAVRDKGHHWPIAATSTSTGAPRSIDCSNASAAATAARPSAPEAIGGRPSRTASANAATSVA